MKCQFCAEWKIILKFYRSGYKGHMVKLCRIPLWANGLKESPNGIL